MNFKGGLWILTWIIVLVIVTFIPFLILAVIRSLFKRKSIGSSIEFYYNKLWTRFEKTL